MSCSYNHFRTCIKNCQSGIIAISMMVLFLVLFAQHSTARNAPLFFTETLLQTRRVTDNQYRDVVLDNRGILYTAHRNGIYEFDGEDWTLITLPGRRSVNCLFVDSQGRVFAGSDGQMGYLKPSHTGLMLYHSLNHTLPEDFPEMNERIVQIAEYDSHIIFFSDFFIFMFEKNSGNMKVIPANSMFFSLLIMPQGLFVVDQHDGLMKYQENKFQRLPGLRDVVSFCMIPFNDEEALVFSPGEDIFVFSARTHKISRLQKPTDAINTAFIKNGIRLFNGEYALSSAGNGLIIADSALRFSYSIHQDNGLGHNIVYNLLQDNHGNIFAATNEGITIIYDRYNQSVRTPHNPPRYSTSIRAVSNHLSNTRIFEGAFLNQADSLPIDQQPSEREYRFEYNENSFQFAFSSNKYFNRENVQYQYYLEGFDRNWSSWSNQKQTFTQYTNLGKGRYTMHVRAKDSNELMTTSAAFSFRIMPIWYETFWFFSLQIGFLMVFIVLSLYLYHIGAPEIISGKLITITMIIIFTYVEMFLQPIYDYLAFAMVLAIFISAVIIAVFLVPAEDLVYRLIEKHIKRKVVTKRVGKWSRINKTHQ